MTKEYSIYKVTDGNSCKYYQILTTYYFLWFFSISYWDRYCFGDIRYFYSLEGAKQYREDLRYRDNARKKRYELVVNAHLIFEEEEG